jgi:hypothetical protein
MVIDCRRLRRFYLIQFLMYLYYELDGLFLCSLFSGNTGNSSCYSSYAVLFGGKRVFVYLDPDWSIVSSAVCCRVLTRMNRKEFLQVNDTLFPFLSSYF